MFLLFLYVKYYVRRLWNNIKYFLKIGTLDLLYVKIYQSAKEIVGNIHNAFKNIWS